MSSDSDDVTIVAQSQALTPKRRRAASTGSLDDTSQPMTKRMHGTRNDDQPSHDNDNDAVDSNDHSRATPEPAYFFRTSTRTTNKNPGRRAGEYKRTKAEWDMERALNRKVKNMAASQKTAESRKNNAEDTINVRTHSYSDLLMTYQEANTQYDQRNPASADKTSDVEFNPPRITPSRFVQHPGKQESVHRFNGTTELNVVLIY